MSQRTKAFVNLSAISHNLKKIKERVGLRKILAMIKANAYGHGIIKIAETLSDADAFGVACVEEAAQLIQAQIQKPIHVMSGFSNQEELKFIDQHRLICVIHHRKQLEFLEKFPLKNFLTIWLKIDTGMHRLGVDPSEVDEFLLRLNRLEKIQKPVNLMTHLADADNSHQEFTLNQIHLFKKITDKLPGLKSMANSAAIFAYPDYLADYVRPGITLYGVSPFSERTGEELQLQPALTLSSKIISIKKINRGEKIGYGCTWECPQDMLIGVVAAGYGDGYPRHANNGTPVLVNHQICPMVGRVSMDMITVDLHNAPETQIGDEVILWGKDLPIEKVAAHADTIGYELMCHVTKRVEFIYC